MRLRSLVSTSVQPTFRDPWWSGRLFVALAVVVSLLIGHRAMVLVFAVSESLATQDLLAQGVPTPVVYSDNGRPTADNARRAVEAYLGFLSDGDAESASKMAGPWAAGESGRFLSNEVLAHAVERISEARVTGVEELPNHRFQVRFSYTLTGLTYSSALELHRKASRWVFDPLITALPVESTRESDTADFSISGVDTTLGKGRWSDYYVYPAVYQLDPHTGEFFVGDPVEVTASISGPDVFRSGYDAPAVEYTFMLSDRASRLLDAGVKTLVDECLTAEGLFGPANPFVLDYTCGQYQLADYSKVSDLSVEVVEYPTAEAYPSWPGVQLSGGMLTLSFNARDDDSGSGEIRRVTDLNVFLADSDVEGRIVDGEVVLG